METQTWTERAIAVVVAEQHTVANVRREATFKGWDAAVQVLTESWEHLERLEDYLVSRLSR